MARAAFALSLALLALVLVAHAHKDNPSHAFVCSLPPPILPGLRDATRADVCQSCLGTPWPVYRGNVTRPRLYPHHETRRQERILNEFFSALLDADDIALVERNAQGMGLAYLDTNFTMCRRPLLIRNSVRNIMSKYGMPVVPVERKWTPVPPEFLS
jgi:hypothetical protein